MATIAVTDTYTSGSAKANIVFTYTYDIAQAADKTTLTVTKLVVSLTQSGSGDNLTNAKNKRQLALNNGVQTRVNFAGAETYKVTINGATTKTISKSSAAAKRHTAYSEDAIFTTGTTHKTVSVSVPAKTSYAVAYNANGGTGAPGSQTKWYSESLTLSSTKPTREGYTFKCWNTNAAGTGTNYNAGASYTANAAATLYAVWEPRNAVNVYDASGNVRKGKVTAYDANGAAHSCIISVYDASGNKRQTQ